MYMNGTQCHMIHILLQLATSVGQRFTSSGITHRRNNSRASFASGGPLLGSGHGLALPMNATSPPRSSAFACHARLRGCETLPASAYRRFSGGAVPRPGRLTTASTGGARGHSGVVVQPLRAVTSTSSSLTVSLVGTLAQAGLVPAWFEAQVRAVRLRWCGVWQ
jgi:hypothetical protein